MGSMSSRPGLVKFSTSLTKPASSRVFNFFKFLSHALILRCCPVFFSDVPCAPIRVFLVLSNSELGSRHFIDSNRARLRASPLHTTDNAAACFLVCSSHSAAVGLHWSVRSKAC